MADGSLDTSGVPRPPGLRPNQKTGNPCDNLHDQGHCHWGDRCYYAHSPEETELFRQWVRAVKVGWATGFYGQVKGRAICSCSVQ